MTTERSDTPISGSMAQTTTEPRTIDLTPTWAGILPGLLSIIRAGEHDGQLFGDPVQSVKYVEAELARMARLADAYVQIVKQEAAQHAAGVSPR